jgi:hypothetical protein
MTTVVDRQPTGTADQAPGTGAPPVVRLAGPPPVTLVPVTRGGRTVGAYLVRDGEVRYQPVWDLDEILSVALGAVVVAGVGFGIATAVRRPPAVGAVTMGPGGWLSLKGLAGLAPRPSRGRRPWWARLLRARRLAPER